MEALKPIPFVRSLKILGETFVFAYSNWRRLLPVVVGVFSLNLALSELMVNLASPHVNLDFMRPYFELADNSTERADALFVAFPHADKKASPSWAVISAVGEVFYELSIVVAIPLFSKACSYNLPEGQHPASFPFSSTWMEWKSLGLLLITGSGVVFFISILLQSLDLENALYQYIYNYFAFLQLLTAVVCSKEGLYGFSAVEKAWALVSGKSYEINVLCAAVFALREILDAVYMTVFLPRKDLVAANVIREDTPAEIFRFSVVAALVTVILQTFNCLLILTFYSSDDAGRPTEQDPLRDRNDATVVIAATHTQPCPEAEAVRRGPVASGGSDASSSNGGRALNLERRTPRPKRQTRPHPKYDPRVWQL